MKRAFIVCMFIGLISCKGQEKEKTVFKNVSVEQFKELIAKDNSQLIDVRTPKEYAAGHLKKAQLINFLNSNFKDIAFSEVDKEKPVLIYCASGGRSARAAKIYASAGFKKVYNLIGGIKAWKAKNLEITK